ncbi:10704_t:CDS:2 [Dentiscutata heterogama]|uniref:10704_t:CDS:1 n=1 Tax=Dentiscutata heterogama TaxID=1316150 RepID=A0ACA9KVA1_9GLOM|nr:10704_t:CDS:2 [Dentiscutata heterogama]
MKQYWGAEILQHNTDNPILKKQTAINSFKLKLSCCILAGDMVFGC